MYWLVLFLIILLIIRILTRRQRADINEAARPASITDLTDLSWIDVEGRLAGAPATAISASGSPASAGSIALSYPRRMVVGRPRAFVVRLSPLYLERIAEKYRVPGEEKERRGALHQQPYVLAPLIDVELQADPAFLTATKSAGRPAQPPSALPGSLGDLPLWIWNIAPIKSGTARVVVRVLDVSEPAGGTASNRPLADPSLTIAIRSRWAHRFGNWLIKGFWAGMAALALWFWAVYVQPQSWAPLFSAIRKREWLDAWNAFLTILQAIWAQFLASFP